MGFLKGLRTYLFAFAVSFLSILEMLDITTFGSDPRTLLVIAAVIAALRTATTTPPLQKE